MIASGFRRVFLLLLLLLLGALAGAIFPGPVAAVSTAYSSDAVQRAFDLILDVHVHPPRSDELLRAAWSGAQLVSPSAGPPPPFDGTRLTDWQAFAAELELMAARPGVDEEILNAAVISAMAWYVNEGHTYYLTRERYHEYLQWLQGDVRYSGIGARMDVTAQVIVEVFPDSPAQAAGLRSGDRLVEVNGRPVLDMPPGEVIESVRGESGTVVNLRVERFGESEPLEFLITRAELSVPFVTSLYLDGDVGYLRLRGFADAGVADDFEAALREMQNRGARSLVIDLRGNSGGRLDVGVRLLSAFIENGILYRQVDREGATDVGADSATDQATSLPLAVLVDGGTASMGEVFAAAIQDRGRGTLIGTPTAGNVAAARVFGLPDGSGLQVTVMEILSANGRVLNGVGVVPDNSIELDPLALRQGRDVQLEAALQAVGPRPVISLGWFWERNNRRAQRLSARAS